MFAFKKLISVEIIILERWRGIYF